MKILSIILGLFLICFVSKAQYNLCQLSSAKPLKTNVLDVGGIYTKKDTTFINYTNSALPFTFYKVNTALYAPVFYPNPTGLYLNGQHFFFYSDVDKSFKESIENLYEVFEFSFLNHNYLYISTLKKQTRYKIVNIFDITNPLKITSISFISLFIGLCNIGDFNADGSIDFLGLHNRKPETYKAQAAQENCYTVKVYTHKNNKMTRLDNDTTDFDSPKYIYAKFDTLNWNFKILQHDWLTALKDENQQEIPNVLYYKEIYSCFSGRPLLTECATNNGIRISANSYTIVLAGFDDMEGISNYLAEVNKERILKGNFFIYLDQYGKDVKFLLLYGYYNTKEEVSRAMQEVKQKGIEYAKIMSFKY
jgi:hypothetical protein